MEHLLMMVILLLAVAFVTLLIDVIEILLSKCTNTQRSFFHTL